MKKLSLKFLFSIILLGSCLTSAVAIQGSDIAIQGSADYARHGP